MCIADTNVNACTHDEIGTNDNVGTTKACKDASIGQKNISMRKENSVRKNISVYTSASIPNVCENEIKYTEHKCQDSDITQKNISVPKAFENVNIAPGTCIETSLIAPTAVSLCTKFYVEENCWENKYVRDVHINDTNGSAECHHFVDTVQKGSQDGTVSVCACKDVSICACKNMCICTPNIDTLTTENPCKTPGCKNTNVAQKHSSDLQIKSMHKDASRLNKKNDGCAQEDYHYVYQDVNDAREHNSVDNMYQDMNGVQKNISLLKGEHVSINGSIYDHTTSVSMYYDNLSEENMCPLVMVDQNYSTVSKDGSGLKNIQETGTFIHESGDKINIYQQSPTKQENIPLPKNTSVQEDFSVGKSETDMSVCQHKIISASTSTREETLTTVQLNVSGLQSKLNNGILDQFLANYDLIFLCETNTDAPYFTDTMLQNYTSISKQKSNSAQKFKYGGIHGLTVLFNPATVINVEEISDTVSECVLWLKVRVTENIEAIFGSVYIPCETSRF